MSISSDKQRADYSLALQKGISFVRSLRGGVTGDTGSREENLQRLKDEMENAETIVIGCRGRALHRRGAHIQRGAIRPLVLRLQGAVRVYRYVLRRFLSLS